MTGLSVAGLYRSFGRQRVLTGLDLAVPSGQLVAVLGPSGSGKTTLLRVLAGLDRPDAGTIKLGDRVVDDGRRHEPAHRRRIGYVPQDGALFPHLTVARNVAFGLSGADRKTVSGELLDRVGLAGLGQRYPHQLSGGQQQRVALARALAVRPDLVLLDEPFSALDASLRSVVRDDVRRILREFGTTALLVTHDQDEALSMADLVAVMRDGRIGQVASPQELYTRPVDPGLAEFVGKANLVPGEVTHGAVHTVFGALTPHTELAEHTRAQVLLRPEQIELRSGQHADGLTGVVVRCNYHGHDSLIAIRPDRDAGAAEILVRIDHREQPTLANGDRVTMTAHGPVTAWTPGD